MRNYFKKFSIMLVMSFVLILGNCISAFAVDDYTEIGTNNLNNTVNNSAKFGDILMKPEMGWKRYDDTSSNIAYNSYFNFFNNAGGTYKNTIHRVNIPNGAETANIKFSFYGSKLRLISRLAHTTLDVSHGQISIDGGNFENFKNYVGANLLYAGLLYEKTGMDNKVHSVTLQYNIKDGANYQYFDALDIDKDGYLVPIAKAITLDQSYMNLKENTTGQLTTITTPAAVGVTWTSSDSSIVAVDSNGKVTALKVGQETITATTTDGSNLSATCTVTVSKNESITLNKSTLDLNLVADEKLIATTSPAGAQVTWTSNDSSIATVDSNGKVQAVSVGKATITAQITGTNITATCVVTVTKEVVTDPEPTPTPDPTPAPTPNPTVDKKLFIELVDGNIKQYDVSSDEINKFINWYNDRDNDDSQPPTYKFTKGTYIDYVVHDKIDWFEIR